MLNEMIKASRKAQNRTQKVVSKSIGMKIQRYRRVESGDASLSMSEIEDVLNEFDLVIKPKDAQTLNQLIVDKIKELNSLI